MNQPLIEFENVTYAYAAEEGMEPLPAVRDLTFAIERGEFVALVGHNGSGKSTVAKLCNGLIAPQGGRVLAEGIDTAVEDTLFDVRRRVGMVFQNPDNQIIAAVVEDDVAFGPENLRVPPEEIRARVDGALQAVGMYDQRLSEPHKLSGGQKQRVAIAGVLAMQTDMIVLDESTAMLDPRGRREVMDTVLRLNRERGITVLFITHFMDEAARAGRVLVMHEGEILLDGPPREVFAQAGALRRAGLELPVPALFADMVRAEFQGLPKGILTEEECAQAIRNLQLPMHDAQCTACDVQPDTRPREASSNCALETKALTYRYSNTAKSTPAAIEGIDLRVEAGELLAIIGHTGSGKSTLVQHLNALLKPTDGLVLVDGKNIWDSKKAIRAARFWVGLCFQYPEYQLFEETVEKDIAFGPKNMGLPPEELHRRVLRAMEYVGLPQSCLAKSPFDLSGGERRRAAIAGVMAMEPQALVLDEPTAGLDPVGKEQILAMIARYRAETGRTVLLISHNMEEVARMADHVLVMDRGRAAMHGTVEQVFARGEALAAMGLTVPTVTRIFIRLREMGLPVGAGVYTMEQGLAELRRVKQSL